MLIFVSYARPDRERVLPFVSALRIRGFDVWMDFRDLKPGQDWRFEIERAMDEADIILAFVSVNSVDHRGFVQRELRSAMDRANEKLIDDIYLIPVMLDDGIEIPRPLRRLHCISASESDALDRLASAINHQIGRHTSRAS
jgi:hypothetical protein